MITECVFNERLADGGADEKRQLYQHFISFGATEGFAYDRLFKEGFLPWEMRGILGCRIDFLHRMKEIDGVEWEIREVGGEPTTDEIFHYRLYYPMPDGTERSIDLNQKGDWWVMLGDLKRRIEFGRWMQERGMKSLTTVTKRFSTDDWREFERVGIVQVIKSFCEKRV